MADHGIIIDVGFQPQIEEFIKKIENEFKKINYDEVIGLSDSFDKQKKEVEKKLKDLSKQIDEALGGNIGGEPLQQVKDLQKSVNMLCGGFKELVKTLPAGQAQALASGLSNISNQAEEMNATLADTISSIKEISKVSDNVSVAPLNKKKIDEVAESYRALAQAERQASENAYLSKKHGNKPIDDEELLEENLKGLLKNYSEIQKTIKELDKDSSDYASSLDILKSKLLSTITEMSRITASLGDLGIDENKPLMSVSGIKKNLEGVEEFLDKQFDSLRKFVADRKAKLQAEFTSLGGEGSLEDSLFQKSTAQKDILKIPVSIQNGANKKIVEQLNSLISTTNEKIKDNPLLLEVKLVSGVQSKNTQDLLSKIRAELKQIDNNEISSSLEHLLDQANRQIDNAFIININVATQKASAEIKEFIKQAKEDLGQKVSFDPELTLTQENIDKFQKQLDNAGFTIDLSDFVSGLSELKAVLDSDDSKLIKNLTEIKTISTDIKALFKDLSSGKIKINSPIIEGGIVESIELTEEDKNRINEKLQDITIEIKDMLATDQIDDWSNYFINALRKISNEIKVLFGGQANVLSDLLDDFNFSDKLMKRTGGQLSERSGVIGTDHNMYGFGTYDKSKSTSYVSELVKELKNIGVTPDIGYHSHGALKQIAPSINDILGSILDGLNAEIIQGLDEIVVFNTKGFLESNKDIDFSKYKKKLEDAEEKLATEISVGIDKGLDKSEADEIFTSIFKQRLPEIFESVLPKTKYKGKVEDFIQTMGLEEFRNNNPLGLDNESMNSLVQTSGMQKALDVLDQITEKIEVIKSANKDGSLNGAFNLNIDVKQVSVLTDKIQELIDLLGQLPQLFNTAFSSENIKNIKNNSINSQINEIRKEREESQRELDDLLRQIQSLKNPNTRNAPKSVASQEQEQIWQFVKETKDNIEKWKKSGKTGIPVLNDTPLSLKEIYSMLSDDTDESIKDEIRQMMTDQELLQSAIIQGKSLQKEISKNRKTTTKTKTPKPVGILESARKQQEAQEKLKQERTNKLIEELEAKAALIQQKINLLDQKEQELIRVINDTSGEEIITNNQSVATVEKENNELNEQQVLLKEINDLWEQINTNRTKSGNISQSKSSGNLDKLTELGSKLRELKKIGGYANLGLSDKDKKVVSKYYNQTDAPSSPIVVEPIVDKDAFESLPKLVDELVPEKEEVEIVPEIDKNAFENLPKLIDEKTPDKKEINVVPNKEEDAFKNLPKLTNESISSTDTLKDLEKAKNVLAYIRNVYADLEKTKTGKLSETKSGKTALDDLGTRLFSYSKYIGKTGEIPNLKNVLGDSDLSEQNEKLILKYYQNAIDRAEELNSMLTKAPKLVDDRYSQEDILKAVKQYYDAKNKRYPFETEFVTDYESGLGGDAETFERFNIGKKLREQLENGTITEQEIEEIFEKKFQKAFNNISLMFPNIEPDEIERVFSNLIDVFGSIEKASKALYDSLYNNLDIESIVKKQVSSETLSYFLDELQIIKDTYIKNPKAYDIEDLQYINQMASSRDLLPDDLNTFKAEIEKVLPLINRAYESLTGRPRKYSDEQKEILSQLENEKLTLSEILSLWEQLNIQAEKGVALQGNSVASKTVIGDLENVSFEELNNIPNGLFKSFDTLLHSHADGVGTFSVEDISLVIQNWEAGVRKLLLFVDGELQSLDFSAATKEQVIKFQQEFANAFESKVAESLDSGIKDVFDNNEIFSKIKSEAITPLLSKYGFNIESQKIQSSGHDYSDKDIVFETDAVIQDNAKLVEQYEKEAEALDKVIANQKELNQERENNYSDDMIVFETDAVLKDTSELVEQYEKEAKTTEDIREELQKSLAIEERYLKMCKEGSEAYNKRLENVRKIKEELSALVNFTTVGEPQEYGFTMRKSETDGSINPPALVDDSAEKTTKALEDESVAMDKVEKAARKSAKSKKDFADANKKDAQSAEETEKNVLAETNAFDKLNNELSTDVISDQSEEFKKASKMAHEYFEELGDIVSITKTMGTYNAYNKENNAYEKQQRISYRVVDTEGKSRTFNPQGDLIGSKDVIDVAKAYNKLESAMKECYELELKMQTEKGDAVIENKLVDAREKYAKAEEEVNNLRDKGLSIAERELRIDEKALAYNEALLSNTQKYYENRSKNPMSNLNKQILLGEDVFNSESYNNNNGFKDRLAELIQQAKEIDSNDINRVNELSDAIKRLLSSEDAKSAKIGLVTKLTNLRKQITQTISNNTRMSQELRSEYQSLAQTIDDMTSGRVNYYTSDVQDIIQSLSRLDTKMRETGQNGDSMWKRISNRLSDMNSKLIAQYLSWQDMIRYVRSAVNVIHELDTALIDLRKTTTMTTDELNEFYYSASDTASQMGVTTSEIISQAAAWSRLGYSSKEAATEMAALSSQFAQISPGMSVETATDGLVSSMKAFGFEVDEVERKIMDNINRIGNTMATTNEEIVQMLERSSAAMSAANNSIEETIALESAAVQVTRNAETTGTAFRTISMRIRGYDEETEELSEEYENLSGKIANLTKTAKSPGGISLFSDKDKKTFKSTYQLLKDISEIWDELSDKEQAQLTEKLAGKRGGQVLSAIMNDFSEVERAMTEMSQAAGSSDKEMEIIEESIDYKINAIKQSWVGFMQDVLKREDLGKLFDSLLKGSESLQKTLSTLTPIITPLIEALAKLIEEFAKLNESTNGLAGVAGLIYGGSKIGKKVNDVRGTVGGLLGSSGVDKKSILSGSSLDSIKKFLSRPAFGEVIKTTEKMSSAATKASGAMGEIAVAEKAAGAAAGTATISMGALLAIVAAIGVAVYAGAKAWDYYTTTVEETEEQIKETKGKIEELQSEIDELNSKDDRNEYENNRLSILKQELEVQKDLLDIEERRRLSEKYGTKFEDAFDENNQNVKIRKNKTGQDASNKLFGLNILGAFVANRLSKESEGFYKSTVGKYDNLANDLVKALYDGVNKLVGSKSSTVQNYKNKKLAYENINNSIEEERANLDTKNKNNPKNQEILNRIHELEKTQGKLKEELDLSILDVQEMFSNAILERDQIKQDIDSGLLTDKELKTASKNLEYYEKLIDELNQLLVKEQKESGTYDFFESYDFSNAIENDEEALKELINSEKDNSAILSKLKSQYPDLIALMDREGIALDDLIKKYGEYSKEQEQATNNSAIKFNKAGMIDAITDLSDGFDKLDEIYADVFDKGSFDFTKLSTKKFEEAFKGLEDEYVAFIETVAANPDNLEASQEAFDKLATAYIKQSGILEGLSEETKDVTINMLKNMGVANAEEVVLSRLSGEERALAEEKKFVTKCTKELSDATVQEIDEFIKEEKYSDEAAQSIYLFALQKRFAKGIDIFNSSDLDYLYQMAERAGIAKNKLVEFANAKAKLATAIAAVDADTALVNEANEKYKGSAITFVNNEEKLKAKEEAAAELQSIVDDLQSEVDKEVNVEIDVPIKYEGADKTKDAIDKANKSGEESKEIFDWIEKALQRQEEEINRIDKTVNATYKDWSKRNSSLLSELNEVNKEIAMQRTAYQAYMRDAEAIPLSEEYKKLVREGAMKSEIISDKTLKKNIKEYEELYDKAIKAKDAVADLEAKLASLAKLKFDNVKSEFEGFTSEIEHFVSMIDKQLSHVENMNKIAGKSFYNAKMEQDTEKINSLYQEREALMQSLRDAEANGIEAGSADWIAMRNDIYAVDEAIADLTYEVEDLKKKLKEVAKLNFDNLKEQFENALSIINNQKGLTDAVVSMVETSGHMASRAYYESLIEGSKATVTGLRKEYETLTKALADAIAAGDIKEYDEQWYQMQSDIAAVKNELVDAANATIEYANALRQINWDVFDRGLDTISKLVDESEFFVELLSYDDLFDKDTGDWTNAGITTRGLMVEEFQAYMDQANAYGKEAQEIKKLLESDPKNTTLIDRYYELIEAQRQAILNTKKEQKAVQDLYKQAYDNLLERIKKLIDKYKEALQASKDLYDYENTIQEKNKTINDIRKQLLAYGNGNDTSEENRATLQKLNAELATAQKDLEQTEYDKYIQDQQNLLDQFYNELQEWIDGRLDNIEALFEEAIEATNLNGLVIDNTLHENADAVNYQMTEEFMSIWDKYADGEGYAALSYDILGLTNDVTNGIRDKMEELPTDANLSQYFDGVDLAILEQIASEENNANNMTNAINMTNEGINRISSNIVELSNTLGSKIDYAGSSVANAINSLDFSTGSGGYDAPGGGNYDSGGSTNPSSNNPSSPSSPSSPGKTNNGNQYTVYQTRSTNGQSMNEQKGTFSTAGEANEYKRKLESTYRNTGASFVVRMYAKGGLIGKNKNILDSIAQLFGEDHMIAAKEGERVLTEDQTKNFEKMVNANFTPLDADAKDKYSMLSGLAGKDISSSLANIPTPEIGNLTNVGNTTTVGDVSITLPNVTNKEEFVEWLKNDGQIERIIQSMTIGRLSGGNSYAKLRF